MQPKVCVFALVLVCVLVFVFALQTANTQRHWNGNASKQNTIIHANVNAPGCQIAEAAKRKKNKVFLFLFKQHQKPGRLL